MSYQQYFVAIATVIPVFFLANVVQFREFSDARFKSTMTMSSSTPCTVPIAPSGNGICSVEYLGKPVA